MYRLEHDSPYTRYTVDFYQSIEACMADCVKRYGRLCIFKLQEDGSLAAKIFAEDEITLILTEIKEAAL